MRVHCNNDTSANNIVPTTTQGPQKCIICDNPSAGVYYKVRACDGCRSFFRRMIHRGQRNDICIDRDNRTIVECRAKTGCKKCRFALCMRAGMRPWYLREACDVFFPFPMIIPSVADSELSTERRVAALLQADIAHENMRLSKYEPTLDRVLTLNPLLSAQFTPNNAQSDTQHTGLRKRDRLSTDLGCAIEYIKAFEFFPSLSIESKRALSLRSGLVLTNFTAAFSYFFKGMRRRDVLSSYYGTDFRPIEVMHRIALSVQEASIVKALIVCNPAIEGIDSADLPVLQAENDEYGKMLFALLATNRGTTIAEDHRVFIQAPVIFVEIIALFELLFNQALQQKASLTCEIELIITFQGHRLLLVILGEETSPCPLLDDVMMS